MGKELFAKHPVFRKWMFRLNDIVSEIIGESLLDRIYDENKSWNHQFDRTVYSHPAIFMVEYSMARVLIESGIGPDYVLGGSLGEFASAAVAGVLQADEALELIIEQAQAFEAHCQKGGMTAILHDSQMYPETPVLYENSELVSVNYKTHFVVSGPYERLETIEWFLDDREIIYQKLPVSYAYHSTLIDSAAPGYLALLKDTTFPYPQVNFVSGLEGNIIGKLPWDYFWNIVRKPIRFTEAVINLEKQGSYCYFDLGPGGTLANFVKRIIEQNSDLRGLRESKSEIYASITPFNQEMKNIEKIKSLYTGLHKSGGKVEKMITFVFPGQGSQHKGMGGLLFDEFAEITAQADTVLGYSIKELCLEDPRRRLGQTQFTQPALYTVNALSYLKKIKDTGKTPDYVAGHSLGEYSALFAAGVFDFETGLKLVKKRGKLMSRATDGGMAALLGLNEEKVEDVLIQNGLDSIDIANYNTPSQIVISGRKADIDRAGSVFDCGDTVYIPLNVSGAFHSRYMNEAKRAFEEYLDMFDFAEPSIPVISNVYARPYKQGETKKNLAQQIIRPVKWTESIRYLMGLGKMEAGKMGPGEMEFAEIGPGEVLTKLVKSIQREAEPLVVEEPLPEKKTVFGLRI